MSRVIKSITIHDDRASIRVSTGAFKILEVHHQHNVPTIWYETLEELFIPETVNFILIPTGGSIPDGYGHIGTVFLDDTGKVFHVYQNAA